MGPYWSTKENIHGVICFITILHCQVFPISSKQNIPLMLLKGSCKYMLQNIKLQVLGGEKNPTKKTPTQPQNSYHFTNLAKKQRSFSLPLSWVVIATTPVPCKEEEVRLLKFGFRRRQSQKQSLSCSFDRCVQLPRTRSVEVQIIILYSINSGLAFRKKEKWKAEVLWTAIKP